MRPALLFLALALLAPLVAVPLLAQVLVGPPAAPPPPADAEEVAEGGIWHVVRPGEDLRSIARTYYGSARYWRTVQLANDVGLSPRAGRRLWVPGRMPELP